MSLRFIIRVRWHDSNSGATGERLQTVDADVPELQDALTVGGYGRSGYDLAELVGVEILTREKEQQ